MLVMKAQTSRQRSINSISTRRWSAYMAAAAASTLAGMGSAEAEIHYSGNVNIKLTGNEQASLPLSNGASLFFENIWEGSTFVQDFYFSIKGAISGSAREHFAHWVSNLPRGANVSAGRFTSVLGNPYRGIIFTGFSDGYFRPYYGDRGFIGFRFNTGNGVQYGWARIETRADLPHYSKCHETIKDYAWGDPGDVILTGQKRSSQAANANPVTDSLGLLAFGARGLNASRDQALAKTDSPSR